MLPYPSKFEKISTAHRPFTLQPTLSIAKRFTGGISFRFPTNIFSGSEGTLQALRDQMYRAQSR